MAGNMQAPMAPNYMSLGQDPSTAGPGLEPNLINRSTPNTIINGAGPPIMINTGSPGSSRRQFAVPSSSNQILPAFASQNRSQTVSCVS